MLDRRRGAHRAAPLRAVAFLRPAPLVQSAWAQRLIDGATWFLILNCYDRALGLILRMSIEHKGEKASLAQRSGSTAPLVVLGLMAKLTWCAIIEHNEVARSQSRPATVE